MSNLTLDPHNLIHQTREFEQYSYRSFDPSDWYRSTARLGRLMFREKASQTFTIKEDTDCSASTWASASKSDGKFTVLLEHWLRACTGTSEHRKATVFNHLPATDRRAFERFVNSVVEQASRNGVEEWNKIFAYTDFDSMPLYVSILTLAATEEKSNQLPARRVFVERCRKTLRSMGLADSLFDLVQNETLAVPRRVQFLKTAHMVACLEEHSATEGYLDAAISFEKLDDNRSALACIYRNVRYRLRDTQLRQLDADVQGFNFKEANIDTMLAILTATASVKRSLPNRKSLFRNVKHALAKRGLLERGLLDGLK